MLCYFLAAGLILIIIAFIFRESWLTVFVVFFLFAFFIIWFFISVINFGEPRQSMFDIKSYQGCIKKFNDYRVDFLENIRTK